MSSQAHPRADRTGAPGNQIVHVRDNSGNTLEELFKVAYQAPQGSGWSGRQLPESFFKPPTENLHYIDGGARQLNHQVQNSQLPASQQQSLSTAQPPVKHMRSRSSPAQLPNPPLSLPPQPLIQHHKQLSIGDALDERQNQRAPPTHWGGSNPNVNHHFQAGLPAQTFSPNKSLSPAHSTGVSLQVASDAMIAGLLGPIPNGWEMSLTQDGEIYFINHVDRSTSWFLPNMPQELQTRGKPIRIGQLPPQQQQFIHTCLQQQQIQHAHPKPSFQGTEQVVQELQQLRLQREELKRQADEIAHREKMLLEQANTLHPTAQPQGSAPMHNIQTGSSTGLDPFLGTGQENHARQSSNDSGLGGMSATYSLPKTPEDFLCNVDEMESASEGGNNGKGFMKSPGQGSDCNMNDMHQNNIGLDLNNIDTGDITMEDSDYSNILPDLNLDGQLAWL